MWTSTASMGKMPLHPSAVLQAVGQPNFEQVSPRNAKHAICTGERVRVRRALLLPHPPLQDGTSSGSTCLTDASFARVLPKQTRSRGQAGEGSSRNQQDDCSQKRQEDLQEQETLAGQSRPTPAVSWKKSAIICTPEEPRQRAPVSCVFGASVAPYIYPS